MNINTTLATLNPSDPHWSHKIIIALFFNLLPLLGWMLGMPDPFFLESAFPWLIIPGILTALSFGSRYGVYSCLLLAVLSRVYLNVMELPNEQNWLELWSGGLLLTVATGELSGRWRNAYLAAKQETDRLTNTANHTAQQLHLLQVSHSQLEVEALGANQSLWKSLKLLEESVTNQDPHLRLPALAKKMMEILSTYEWLEVAAFYAVNDKGTPYPQPLAQVGTMQALNVHDELLQQALKTQRPVSIKRDSTLFVDYQNLGTSLLAAFPISNPAGKTCLLLAVQQIQFQAFEPSNLNLLATLCSWLATCLEDNPGQYSAITYPTITAENLTHWHRTETEIHVALCLVACHHKSTLLVGLDIEASPLKDQYIRYFTSNIRGSNHHWKLERDNNTVMILLLPMLNGESFCILKYKLENDFHTHFNKSFAQAGVVFHHQYFYRYQHRQELTGYLDTLRQPRYALAVA